jgi:hypothetical protein
MAHSKLVLCPLPVYGLLCGLGLRILTLLVAYGGTDLRRSYFAAKVERQLYSYVGSALSMFREF